ncbi:Uncharacterised protein [Mycobacterium tuberculosis]|nr:Uncharacterised protein [Mycobacterium tuberculosis]
MSIWRIFTPDCRIVPNHARMSGLPENALLKNSCIPVWIRRACSAIMFSMTVTIAQM